MGDANVVSNMSCLVQSIFLHMRLLGSFNKHLDFCLHTGESHPLHLLKKSFAIYFLKYMIDPFSLAFLSFSTQKQSMHF